MIFRISDFVTVISFIFYHFDYGNASQNFKYQTYMDNAKLPMSFLVLNDISASTCAVNCEDDDNCSSFNYNRMMNVCELTDHPMDIVASLTDDDGPKVDRLMIETVSNWTIFYKETTSCSFNFAVYHPAANVKTRTSTNYPQPYQNNENYYWLFIKRSAHSTLHIDFVTMDVEYDHACNFDRITIYNGACPDATVLAIICGTTPQEVTVSRGVYILLNFKSDAYTTKTGFSLNYYFD